jgi:Na+-translocating ferredoxin:NAD+ oxidoreductase RnfG subunit
MSDFVKYPMILFIVTVTCTFLISSVYSFTDPILAKKNEETVTASLSIMYPEMQDYKQMEGIVFESDKIVNLFEVTNSGEIFNVYETTAPGKNGDVKMLISVDSNGAVDNINYTQMLETNGIGSKVAEEDYINKILESDTTNKKVDTISGASISSGAVSSMVEDVLLEFEANGGSYE